MDKNNLIECIHFFSDLNINVSDITSHIDKQNKNKVVIAKYLYKGITYKTKPLYYKEVSNLENVRNPNHLHYYFGNEVFWLDIEKHKWPKGSGESDLDQLVINDITDDPDFKTFLLKLANNKQNGFIQRITKDGRTAQYYHNLENNNHWHDLILLIKEVIKCQGSAIDRVFFQHLIFNWDKGKRTSLDVGRPYKIVTDLYNNIKNIKAIMNTNNITKILEFKKQIILQGPPGTGKTREAKFIATEILGLNNVDDLKYNDQFKLIQFHPSYTYEDFVRGIVAESKGDRIEYKNVNKTLGLFAEEALRNYKASTNTSTESNIEFWIDSNFEDFKLEIEKQVEENEIILSGDITLFKVESDNFRYGKNWDNPSRINFIDFKNLVKAIIEGKFKFSNQQIPKEFSVHAHYRYTYYNALLKRFIEKYNYKGESYSEPSKNFILIIDEINRANLSSVLGEMIYALEYRGEAVESMYNVNGKELILPPNLYIIGTMNTADRSVGHIDYAIRRRFAFVDVLPENLKETQGLETFDDILFNNVTTLFDTNLSSEFEKKDVQLGHSYFIDKSNEKDGAPMFIRLEFEIKPILREYLKDGVLVGEDIKDKIDALAPSI
ncbi:McrB family protein [Flavobacterium pectinovorum]|uniref:McrB family protein n=1 Tax=Flavobacterium pectinovorum TaxID=29533 RepID=UPI001FAB3DA7|nr:AAA family ATPase [Flavobacterium pectinovorum]